MPIYRLEFEDSATSQKFKDQVVYDDDEAARRNAIRELVHVASSRLPDGDHHEFVVTVLDVDDRPIVRATLSLTTSRFDRNGLAEAPP